MADKSQSGKKLPSYQQMQRKTGEHDVDRLLTAITNACMRLESLAAEVDQCRDEMARETVKSPRNEETIKALRRRLDALVAQIVEIENKELPALMQIFREAAHEKSLSNVVENINKRLSAVRKTSDLDVAAAPGEDDDSPSPWTVD